jgi:multidrug efflux pump subunit AcrB
MDHPENKTGEKSGDSLYLQKLKYTADAGRTFLTFFIDNFRVTVLIVISLLAWGVISFLSLPLESMPEVKIPYGIITVTLPGASPEDMEEQVVDKIESKVASLSGVKQVKSSSLNSFASITVEFRAEEDLKDALRRLRDAVSSVKSELPSDATEPTVTEVSFSSTPVWTVVVTGPYDNFTLRKYAEDVQDEIEKLPETDSVSIAGGDTYEVIVKYDPKLLQQYGLSADTVNTLIKANNFSLPLGTLDVSSFEYSLKSEGKFTSVKEVRDLPLISVNSQLVRLKDVAEVMEMAKERNVTSKFSVKSSTPENAVTLNVVKKTGGSIISLIDTGKQKIEKLKNSLPSDLKIETTLDYSKTIRSDFEELWHDGLLTIILVTILLFLFVGLKEAFVAGLAVPLVFATTFGIMNMMGITLNFLSLFSLILSLGLLVDDAIVVVQATKQYLKTGKFTPEEAVLLVFKDYKVLLTTTTLCTIWAFLPLLMASGIIGQYIKSIPITVSVTLAASFMIAIIINHPMAIILERFRLTRGYFRPFLALSGLGALVSLGLFLTGYVTLSIGVIAFAVCTILFFALGILYWKFLRKKLIANEDLLLQEKADPEKIKRKIYHHYLAPPEEMSWFDKAIGGIVKMDKILPYYGRLLRSFLESRSKSFIFLAIVGVIFAGAVFFPVSGILRSEFMSSSDSEYLYVNIEGPPGLVTEKTAAVAAQVEKIVLQENSIKSFSEMTGSAGVNLKGGGLTSASSSEQSNKAQFAINLYPLAQRPKSTATGTVEKSYQMAQRLRKASEGIQGATITVVESSVGPPAGSDFEARITGDDMQELEKLANKYKELLAQIPGTVNEDISLDLSPGEFSLKLNPEQMTLRGLTSAQVSAVLRAAISTSEVTKITPQNEDELVIRSEFDDSNIATIDQLKALPLVNSKGQAYQLSDIATIELGSSLTSISRLDQKRVVSVTAGVEKPYLPGEVLTKFQEIMKSNPLPQGYEVIYGGYNETNTESIYSILRAMLVSMLLIIGTLVLQFNSFKKAILVLATIPLALTGVFYGLTAIGFTLSFPSLIGILALFGIVVKNAVILVDKINLNLKTGIPLVDSIIDASQSRMEAIFLTSICTIIGMIPITLGNETWQGLGSALIFGLSTSTIMTLFAIPILFNLIMKSGYAKEEKLRRYMAEVKNK